MDSDTPRQTRKSSRSLAKSKNCPENDPPTDSGPNLSECETPVIPNLGGRLLVSTVAGPSNVNVKWPCRDKIENRDKGLKKDFVIPNTLPKESKASDERKQEKQEVNEALKDEEMQKRKDNQPVESKTIDMYCPNEKVGKLMVEQITFEDPAEEEEPPLAKRQRSGIYTEDEGPSLYMVKGELVTKPLITKNLPAVFMSLPIFGRPKSKEDFPQFCKDKIRDFMGQDLTDEEFENLSKYCSPSHLLTGVEITMPTGYPSHGFVTSKNTEKKALEKAGLIEGINLCIQKKLQLRIEKDVNNIFPIKLKYRGIRLIPFTEDEKTTPTVMIGRPLEPGRDLVFRIRIYRPYAYNLKYFCHGRTRHSVFSCDIVMVGRQKLSLLRDRIVCANDVGMRVDVSNNPDELPATSAKDVFPSGFLFINNVFYVDTRPGCTDHSAGLRAWAARRGLGRFRVRALADVALEDVVLKLGHPEVYMHQGNCEHLFTFSEVRLMGPLDPARLSSYPAHSAVSQHQSVYCTTCAEFGAKWIVVGCERVPFDPAFFCETCFKLYLYKDGRKIGDFKAYSYRGNELNMLKPQR